MINLLFVTKLTKISLTQFKSFLNQEFKFNYPFIAITGKNGIGKTNLLDAIYYLCYTKSYFNFREAENVHYQTNGFRLEAQWTVNNKTFHAICRYDLSKKQWWINDELLNKNNDYLGHFHAVMVAPDDININPPYVLLSTQTSVQEGIKRCKAYDVSITVDIVTESSSTMGRSLSEDISELIEDIINPDTFQDIDLSPYGYSVVDTTRGNDRSIETKTKNTYLYRKLITYNHLITKL